MGETKTSLDTDLIRALADVMRDTDLAEIEVKQDEDGGFRVRLSRAPTIPYAYAAPAPVIAPAEPPRAPTQHGAPQPVGGAASAAPTPADLARHPGAVPSPMVGTVYRSAEPGARPFVEPGDRVSEGQTILIIEAMKHMNEVQSPRAGTVTAVLVEDGQPVEYGEPLVILE